MREVEVARWLGPERLDAALESPKKRESHFSTCLGVRSASPGRAGWIRRQQHDLCGSHLAREIAEHEAGAGLQACGSPGSPSRCPACQWNWAQPGPRPPNTFHRGRLLRAHTGRGRAAEPGTLRAWERAARKETHGWQGPAPQHGPVPLQPLVPSWHSLSPSAQILSQHPGPHPPHGPGAVLAQTDTST